MMNMTQEPSKNKAGATDDRRLVSESVGEKGVLLV